MRLVVAAAVAATLGITPAELAARQRAAPLRRIAAERGVAVEQVRAAAVRAAEPLLQEAVTSGALTADESRSLRERIRAQGSA